MASEQHQPLSSIQLARAATLAEACGISWGDIEFSEVNIPRWSPAMLAAYSAVQTGVYEPIEAEEGEIRGMNIVHRWRWAVDRDGNIRVEIIDGVEWVQVEHTHKWLCSRAKRALLSALEAVG